MVKKLKGLIPSVAEIFFAACFLYLALGIPEAMLIDCDTGYHVRIGEYIISKGSVPHNDFLSLPAFPLEYIDFEWLSQVIMAIIHGIGKLTAIVIFFSLVISLTFYLQFRFIQKENGTIPAVTVVMLLAFASASATFLARPHVFSMFMFLIWYIILDLYQYREKNYLYWLPGLMFLWVNLHGAFLLGLTLTAAYVFGNFMEALIFKGPHQEAGRKKAGAFLLILIFSLMASLLNPYGFKGFLHPIVALVSHKMVHLIMEYASPNFHVIGMLPFLIFLLLMITVFAFSKKSISAIECFLMIIFAYFALYSMRNIPFFVIVMAPMLVKHTEGIFTEINGKWCRMLNRINRHLSYPASFGKRCLWLILPAGIVVGLASGGTIKYTFDETIKPAAAVEFLKKENIPGNMFNDYEYGDYIIYSAYPQYRVFIDGRADMYGERLIEYFEIDRLEPYWESLLKKYNVNFIIVKSDTQFSKYLLIHPHWHLIYSDMLANIFVKRSPQNKHFIEKYKDIKPYAAGGG